MGFKFKIDYCINTRYFLSDTADAEMEDNNLNQTSSQSSSSSASNDKSKTVPTNFSIERILLKSDTEQTSFKQKPLNKVTANPWISTTPILFKPKVVIGQQQQQALLRASSLMLTPTSPASPLFSQINPIYSSLLQQFPSASNFFASADRPTLSPRRLTPPNLKDLGSSSNHNNNNNNIISVNSYNYFFENHFKQLQSASNSNFLNASSSQNFPLLNTTCDLSLSPKTNPNISPHSLDTKRTFNLFNSSLNHENMSLSSGSSIMIGDLVNSLDDGLKCGICNKMFGCPETLEVSVEDKLKIK